MKYYAFDATRPDGTLVTGELAANSLGEAISALESQGHRRHSISSVASNTPNNQKH